jgi:hypothetical protein
MIGFIRVADIPKMLIGFVVGLILLGALFGVLMSFPGLLRHTPEWVFMLAFFSIIGVSYTCGERIWEWIESRR